MWLKTYAKGLERHKKARLISQGISKVRAALGKGEEAPPLGKEKAEEFSDPQTTDNQFYAGCQR